MDTRESVLDKQTQDYLLPLSLPGPATKPGSLTETFDGATLPCCALDLPWDFVKILLCGELLPSHLWTALLRLDLPCFAWTCLPAPGPALLRLDLLCYAWTCLAAPGPALPLRLATRFRQTPLKLLDTLNEYIQLHQCPCACLIT